MSRRFLINVSAVAALIVLLFWVARSSNYTPSTAPHRAFVRHEAGGPPAAPGETSPADSQGTQDSTGSGATDSAAAPTAAAAEAPSLAAAAALVRHAEIGFESHDRLLEHFDKHGAEFGAATADGYLLLAQALRDRAVGGPVLEARRSDGVTTRFDRGSGAFLAFESDGTIRTFFRPNDGENYFWRQLGRPH